ncbi:MAG: hypothetical protein ABI999_12690 [Acidobacteriota bacterium]
MPLACSWCDRMQDDDGMWNRISSSAKKAIYSAGLKISHGICGSCYTKAIAALVVH